MNLRLHLQVRIFNIHSNIINLGWVYNTMSFWRISSNQQSITSVLRLTLEPKPLVLTPHFPFFNLRKKIKKRANLAHNQHSNTIENFKIRENYSKRLIAQPTCVTS